MIELTLETARAMIASAVLGDAQREQSVGPVVLRPHQADAVARVERLLRTHRGALVADDVGLGKTYVALAVARDRNVVIVCPAAIVPMWREALRVCRMDACIISHESLSRSATPIGADPDLVIVDEAHHARNPATARYRRLAALAARSSMLLLSATPVHNHHRDLCALLALFLGARAWSMPERESMTCVVRRTHDDVGHEPGDMPVVEPMRMLHPEADGLDPHVLLSLPSPVPPRDGGRADALLTLGLVHRWASSRGALEESLRRRLAHALALDAALSDGTYPSRAELRRWLAGGDSIQLGFSELLATAADGDCPTLLAAVRAHADAVRSVLAILARTADPDDDRARLLRVVRAAHPGERVVAFTQFAATAGAYWRRLRHEPGVVVLTAAGAQSAGGALTREEALTRFAPRAHSAPEPRAAERIELLIATDLLSEGVNLQDAAVVVHLDTAWTPARMQQRLGRVARLGSSHARVFNYRVAAPADAETVLELERRLATKLREAGRTVGVAGFITPSLGDTGDGDTSPAHAVQRVRTLLRSWRTDGEPPQSLLSDTRLRFAVVNGIADIALALVMDADGTGRPLVETGGRITDEPSAVAEVVALLSNARSAVFSDSGERVARTRARFERWLANSAAADCIDLGLAAERRERTPVLQRITSIASRAPYHRRSAIAPLALEARRAATASYGIGAQRVLVELADAPMDDEAWLRAVAAFGSANARSAAPNGATASAPRLAILLIGAQG